MTEPMNPDEEQIEKHPAFGMVGFSRCHGLQRLHGSDILHQETIRLKISNASANAADKKNPMTPKKVSKESWVRAEVCHGLGKTSYLVLKEDSPIYETEKLESLYDEAKKQEWQHGVNGIRFLEVRPFEILVSEMRYLERI